jgi:hypothetical protein
MWIAAKDRIGEFLKVCPNPVLSCRSQTCEIGLKLACFENPIALR